MRRKEHVVILHGLGRTHFSMAKVERALARAGFRTHNVGYPSTRHDIDTLTKDYIGPVVETCRHQGAESIHFVTHSLGGILVRRYLQTHVLPEGSRIVMLVPPNQGSELAEWLRKFRLYRWLLGPVGQQLGTEESSVPRSLKPVDAEIGVIAGNDDSFSPFSFLFEGDNDGKVAVERAKIPEMKDFLIVAQGHAFLMNDAAVIEQILFFLKNGRFRA
ncbi:MAG: alpha/beta fold hydrolase [Pseudomonadota bacterium]